MKALSILFLGIALSGCAKNVKVTPLSLSPAILISYADCGEYRDDYLRLHVRFDSPMKTSAGAFAAWAYIDRDKNHPSDNSNGDTRVLYNEQGEYIDTLMDERSRYKVFSAGEEADVLLFSELIVPTDSSHDPTQPKQGISLLHDNYDQLRVQIRLTNIVGGADSNTMTFSRDEVIKALTNQSKTEIRVPLSPHAECPNNTK